MGQTRSHLSKRKPRSEQLSRNPMRNKVLSCLGRRKRYSSQTEGDLGYGTETADVARRGHRAGKLPRDETVSASGEYQAATGVFEILPGLGDDVEAVQLTVSREEKVGSSDASCLETRSAEVSCTGCTVPRPGVREDDASDPPARAMEDQRMEGNDQNRFMSGFRTDLSLQPLLTSDPDTERTSSCSHQDLDGGLSILNDRIKGELTQTESTTGDQNNGFLAESGSIKHPDQITQSPSGQTFPGTIPKLIITRDPSPSRSQGTTDLQSDQTLCLDPQADDESPCSDSGCGGSPALMRSPRKLSTSSSIGLSSASSFEESEDDFTGSDIESSLSPVRSLCSAGEATGVSVLHHKSHWVYIQSEAYDCCCFYVVAFLL
ncbi:hypothetical protein GOODEAATRI_024536 [Goodea atripinnis]|uniref:Uncharacterized protein n=1 Tax=Goodea atripinnis TaxID=208336 RepID=A0ABV0P7I3_9TELE